MTITSILCIHIKGVFKDDIWMSFLCLLFQIQIIINKFVERSGSGIELQTLDYEKPGSNPGCVVKTLGKFFHSTLLQFTQLNKTEYLAIDSGGYVYEQPSRINCSIWLDSSQRRRDDV